MKLNKAVKSRNEDWHILEDVHNDTIYETIEHMYHGFFDHDGSIEILHHDDADEVHYLAVDINKEKGDVVIPIVVLVDYRDEDNSLALKYLGENGVLPYEGVSVELLDKLTDNGLLMSREWRDNARQNALQ